MNIIYAHNIVESLIRGDFEFRQFNLDKNMYNNKTLYNERDTFRGI